MSRMNGVVRLRDRHVLTLISAVRYIDDMSLLGKAFPDEGCDFGIVFDGQQSHWVASTEIREVSFVCPRTRQAFGQLFINS